MHDHANLLHRDVSAGNLYLWDSTANDGKGPEEGMCGFVSDLELALDLRPRHGDDVQAVRGEVDTYIPAGPDSNTYRTGAIVPVKPGEGPVIQSWRHGMPDLSVRSFGSSCTIYPDSLVGDCVLHGCRALDRCPRVRVVRREWTVQA
jgi:hypothetical protein